MRPRGLVVHGTGNRAAGAHAAAHRDYFEGHPQRQVAAHYVVDDRSVIRCVPEDEVAYHAGAARYREAAVRHLGPHPGRATIGVEICVNRDGDFALAWCNAASLAADILQRHGWGVDAIYRHFDLTGKRCPDFMVVDEAARAHGLPSAAQGWDWFRAEVEVRVQCLRRGLPVPWPEPVPVRVRDRCTGTRRAGRWGWNCREQTMAAPPCGVKAEAGAGQGQEAVRPRPAGGILEAGR
jgi:hypothetical protein